MKTKVCFRCKRELPVNKFSGLKRNKDGLKSSCKECIHQDYLDHITTYKEYTEKNKEIKCVYNKKYKADHKQETSDYNKKYSKEHREVISIRNKLYNKENAEPIKARHKLYQMDNKEMLRRKRSDNYYKNIVVEKARMKKYKTSNKESFVIRQQHREAGKRNLENTLTMNEWENIKERFNNSCAYCGKVSILEQEHFIPLTKGGEYATSNIIPACKSCNCSKNDKLFSEWYPAYRHFSKKREKQVLEYLGYKNSIQQKTLAF